MRWTKSTMRVNNPAWCGSIFVALHNAWNASKNFLRRIDTSNCNNQVAIRCGAYLVNICTYFLASVNGSFFKYSCPNGSSSIMTGGTATAVAVPLDDVDNSLSFVVVVVAVAVVDSFFSEAFFFFRATALAFFRSAASILE